MLTPLNVPKGNVRCRLRTIEAVGCPVAGKERSRGTPAVAVVRSVSRKTLLRS